jgi:hypothetical protein
MDFADALHLATSRGSTKFITFDRDTIKVGKRLGLTVQPAPFAAAVLSIRRQTGAA